LKSDQFFTVESSSQGIFKAKGSKHLGFVFPVKSEDDVQRHLKQLRKTYHDARHCAYAFRLEPDGIIWRASDDGEPSNSAGPPILGALRSKELTNCMGAVVRYFGGTKLGVSGLIEAYREATLDAIENANIIQQWVYDHFEVRCPFDHIGTTMSMIEQYSAQLLHQEFTVDCRIQVGIRKSKAMDFHHEMNSIFGIEIRPIEDPQSTEGK